MTSMNFEPIQLTRGQAVRKWIKDHNPPWIALTILFLLLFCGLFANFIVGDPMTNDLKARQIPPFTDINLKAGDTLRTDWFPVVWSR